MEDLIGQPGLPGPAGPQGMPVSWGQIIIFSCFQEIPQSSHICVASFL